MKTKRPRKPAPFVEPCRVYERGRLFFRLPIQVISEANQREHWTVRNTRKKIQQLGIAIEMQPNVLRKYVPKPNKITFQRFGVKPLDSDNLAGSFKHVRDQIAKLYGVDDSPSGPIKWVYDENQIIGKGVGIEITIEGEVAA